MRTHDNKKASTLTPLAEAHKQNIKNPTAENFSVSGRSPGSWGERSELYYSERSEPYYSPAPPGLPQDSPGPSPLRTPPKRVCLICVRSPHEEGPRAPRIPPAEIRPRIRHPSQSEIGLSAEPGTSLSLPSPSFEPGTSLSLPSPSSPSLLDASVESSRAGAPSLRGDLRGLL